MAQSVQSETVNSKVRCSRKFTRHWKHEIFPVMIEIALPMYSSVLPSTLSHVLRLPLSHIFILYHVHYIILLPV